MEKLLSLESRRAFFRAQLMAVEAGQREVSVSSLMAALLVSPAIVQGCQEAGFTVAQLIETFGLEGPLRCLEEAEVSLAENGLEFGSREHIDSLADTLRPPSEQLRAIVRRLDEWFPRSDIRVSVFDILEALIGPQGPLAETASAIGLTVAALRAHESDDQNSSGV